MSERTGIIDGSDDVCEVCKQPLEVTDELPPEPPRIPQYERSGGVEIPFAWGCVNPDCPNGPVADLAPAVDSPENYRAAERMRAAEEGRGPDGR